MTLDWYLQKARETTRMFVNKLFCTAKTFFFSFFLNKNLFLHKDPVYIYFARRDRRDTKKKQNTLFQTNYGIANAGYVRVIK